MRVLLADDQPRVRFALRTLLERRLGAEVVGEAADAEELLEQLHMGEADLILLDWQLPGQAVRKLVATLLTCTPRLAVVALSGQREDEKPALEAGADAFVCKCDHPEELLSALRDIETRREGTVADRYDNKVSILHRARPDRAIVLQQ